MVLLLLLCSCLHPVVELEGEDGCSEAKGSVTPCPLALAAPRGPHNLFLESCCLASLLGSALVNSGWFGGGGI